jgi:hypothetical protein
VGRSVVLCAALVLVSCGPTGPEPAPVPSATVTPDPGRFTFVGEDQVVTWVLEEPWQAEFAALSVRNDSALSGQAHLELTGDPRFWSDQSDVDLLPDETATFVVNFDHTTLYEPGEVQGTAEVTATNGVVTASHAIGLHLEVLPPPLWIQLDTIAAMYQVDLDCPEQLGSGRVFNSSALEADVVATLEGPEVYSVEPAGATVEPGGWREFTVLLDCGPVTQTGHLEGVLTLSADTGQYVASKSADVLVFVVDE